jgi:hypothetical protein
MRVKIPALRSHSDYGEEVKSTLQNMDGVRAVSFSPLTGSLVVCFNQDRISPEQILGFLQNYGLLDTSLVMASDEPNQLAVTPLGLRIGKAALGWVLGKALEDSALSLLAALI